jgi:hypothetical protein
MKQLCVSFMCLESYCFSFSFTTASLHVFVICFDEKICQDFCLKIAGVSRFASKVGHLWYFMGASCKVVSVETLPVLPDKRTARDCPLGKVGETPLQ